MRLLQLTDLHLHVDTPYRNKIRAAHPGVLTLELAVRQARRQEEGGGGFDRVVLTGDHVDTDDGEGGNAFAALRGIIASNFDCPVRAVPGNHDSRPLVRQSFPFAADAAEPPPPPDSASFAEVVGGVLVVGVDTKDDAATRRRRGAEVLSGPSGASGGAFDAAQGRWLRAVLARHAPTPAVLLMHHPPLAAIPGGKPGHPFQQPGELFEPCGRELLVSIVAEHAVQIKAVVVGHIHAELVGPHAVVLEGGVPLLATPATSATQNDLAGPGPELQWRTDGALHAMPGCRVIEVAPTTGVLTTRVVRVPALPAPGAALHTGAVEWQAKHGQARL